MAMVDVAQLAMWAGWIVSIVGAMSIFLKPLLKAFDNINKSLADTSQTIHQIKMEMEQSKRDNQYFYDRLEKHEDLLDEQGHKITAHEAQLKMLLKGKD